MKLLLERLTGSPTAYRFETAPGWWRASDAARQGPPSGASAPFVVDLLAHRMGEDVYLEGTISGSLEFECSLSPDPDEERGLATHTGDEPGNDYRANVAIGPHSPLTVPAEEPRFSPIEHRENTP